MSLKSRARHNRQSNRNLVNAIAGKGIITVLACGTGYGSQSKVHKQKLGINDALANMKVD